MVESDCQAARGSAQDTANELYQIAALMMGDESAAVELVETAVAQTTIDPCAEPQASVVAAKANLVEAAVARLNQADPSAFETPAASSSAVSCIEDDDLSSAGISAGQIIEMIAAPGRRRLRDWLNKLPLAQRAIFVERAILGWDNQAAAASMSKAVSRRWQPDQVSEVFRQALCSLANSLAHSATPAAV